MKCNVVFWTEDQGYFGVVCSGDSKREHSPFCGTPTVEEVKERYSDNAEFIRIEQL